MHDLGDGDGTAKEIKIAIIMMMIIVMTTTKMMIKRKQFRKSNVNELACFSLLKAFLFT